MIPTVNINIANGNLGKTLQTSDGVCGLVCTGLTVGNQNKGFRITSVANAVSQNITSVTEPFAYKQIVEFYSEAGDGAVLYLWMYPEAITMANMVDAAHASNAAKLLDYALGAITLLGIARNPTSETSVPANFVRADVISAVTGSSTLVANYRAKYQPIRILLEGRTDVTTNVPQDLKTYTNNAVSVVLGGTANDGHAAVGLALGRLARVSVSTCVGRVKDGTLPITDAYIGATKVENFTNLTTAIDKGYIVIRNYVGRSGYYFSDDPTASLPTDDFTNLVNGRVIDKALRIAYQTYVNELNESVDVASDGTLSPGNCKHLENIVRQQVRNLMVDEMSFFDAYVDPAQNVIATSQVTIQLMITPKGYSKVIVVNLGLNNPF